MAAALTKQSDNEYLLKKKEQSVWVTVKNLSVYIKREGEGVVVDIFKTGEEAEGCIATACALYEE